MWQAPVADGQLRQLDFEHALVHCARARLRSRTLSPAANRLLDPVRVLAAQWTASPADPAAALRAAAPAMAQAAVRRRRATKPMPAKPSTISA